MLQQPATGPFRCRSRLSAFRPVPGRWSRRLFQCGRRMTSSNWSRVSEGTKKLRRADTPRAVRETAAQSPMKSERMVSKTVILCDAAPGSTSAGAGRTASPRRAPGLSSVVRVRPCRACRGVAEQFLELIDHQHQRFAGDSLWSRPALPICQSSNVAVGAAIRSRRPDATIDHHRSTGFASRSAQSLQRRVARRAFRTTTSYARRCRASR